MAVIVYSLNPRRIEPWGMHAPTVRFCLWCPHIFYTVSEGRIEGKMVMLVYVFGLLKECVCVGVECVNVLC